MRTNEPAVRLCYRFAESLVVSDSTAALGERLFSSMAGVMGATIPERTAPRSEPRMSRSRNSPAIPKLILLPIRGFGASQKKRLPILIKPFMTAFSFAPGTQLLSC